MRASCRPRATTRRSYLTTCPTHRAPRLARLTAYFLSAVVALIAQGLVASFTSPEPLAAIDAIAAAGLAGFFAQLRHGMQLPATPPPVEVEEQSGADQG